MNLLWRVVKTYHGKTTMAIPVSGMKHILLSVDSMVKMLLLTAALVMVASFPQKKVHFVKTMSSL